MLVCTLLMYTYVVQFVMPTNPCLNGAKKCSQVRFLFCFSLKPLLFIMCNLTSFELFTWWPNKHWRSSLYAVMHMRNKNSNIQGRSSHVVKEIFPYHKELLLKERICSIWEQILSFKRSSPLEREAIEENHCLIQ